MLGQKDTVPAEDDAVRADKINNHAVRIIRQLRNCVTMTNEIVGRGDKATIVAALDLEVITVMTAISALGTTHSAEPAITTDLV